MKLICIRLLTKDFPTMLAFWRDVVKLPLKYASDDSDYAYFDVEGAGVELFGRAAFAEAIGEDSVAVRSAGHQAVIDFQVDDVDATYKELVAGGAKSMAQPMTRENWGVRAALLADPEDNLLEIYTSIPGAPTL